MRIIYEASNVFHNYDPLADKKEVKNIYKVDLVSKGELSDLDIIIIAVAHNEFKKMKLDEFKNMFRGNTNIIFDLKNIIKECDDSVKLIQL